MKFAKRSIAAFLSLIIVIGSLCVIPVSAAEAADEYDGMRLKLYNRLLGKDYNPEDAWTKPITAAITDEAMGYWDTMNKSPVSNAVNGSYRDENDVLLGVDSSKDYLWEERPLGKRGTASGCWYESNNTQWAYIHLKAMAVAYKTVGSELFGNRELLADIKMGLKFLYDHHFNPNVIKYGNWYSWELGSPMNLGEIMVMLYDELTPDEITDYATVLTKYLGKNPAQNTGANGLWARRVWLYAGILLKDKAWLDHMKSSLPNFYKYAAGKDGYYTDGTFIQHETLPYNNGYGISCLSDSAFLLYMLSGTQWDMGSSYYDIIYRWLYDSYETVVYDGLAMDSFRRNLHRQHLVDDERERAGRHSKRFSGYGQTVVQQFLYEGAAQSIRRFRPEHRPPGRQDSGRRQHCPAQAGEKRPDERRCQNGSSRGGLRLRNRDDLQAHQQL